MTAVFFTDSINTLTANYKETPIWHCLECQYDLSHANTTISSFIAMKTFLLYKVTMKII